MKLFYAYMSIPLGQAARCRLQTQNVFQNSPRHHFCALRYFSFVFFFSFLPFFLDHCRETFLCPKVFLSSCFL